jgi:hypothetical protein
MARGVLLTRALFIKRSGDRQFVIVESRGQKPFSSSPAFSSVARPGGWCFPGPAFPPFASLRSQNESQNGTGSFSSSFFNRPFSCTPRLPG